MRNIVYKKGNLLDENNLDVRLNRCSLLAHPLQLIIISILINTLCWQKPGGLVRV